jgi:thioredoxin-like negative regulator of GroEL
MSSQIRLDEARAQLGAGRIDDAIRTCTDILGTAPHQPDALYMLGAVALRIGQTEQALEFATTLKTHAPQDARGFLLAAFALRAQQRAEEALVEAEKALARDPGSLEAWECAGAVLLQLGRRREARAHLEKATTRFPHHAGLRGYYALMLAEEGDLAAGYKECRAALEADPENAAALVAQTTIFAHAGYYDLALAACRAAGARADIQKTMNFSKASAALVTGQFAEGYVAMAAARLAHVPASSVPEWQGEENPDLHVALFGEQGFGDTLQFVRFADRVAKKVGRVTARVPAQLERLLRASMPRLAFSVYKPPTTATRQVLRAPDPVFDFSPDTGACCSFLNLPHVLHLEAETDAARVPYLHAVLEDAGLWRERLAAVPRPRIGLVWNGSPQHGNDHNRSIPFEMLAPLVEKFRTHLVSLQVGTESAKARAAGLFDASSFIADFADSAALLSEIDVLITVDTAPLHLAGGLGRPVWVMLPFNPDWRWLLGREDSIWYPTLRLFRQMRPKGWASVVEKIGEEIEKLIGGDRGVLSPKPWAGGFLIRHPQAVALPGIKEAN